MLRKQGGRVAVACAECRTGTNEWGCNKDRLLAGRAANVFDQDSLTAFIGDMAKAKGRSFRQSIRCGVPGLKSGLEKQFDDGSDWIAEATGDYGCTGAESGGTTTRREKEIGRSSMCS